MGSEIDNLKIGKVGLLDWSGFLSDCVCCVVSLYGLALLTCLIMSH